jgi:hypothetical protein
MLRVVSRIDLVRALTCVDSTPCPKSMQWPESCRVSQIQYPAYDLKYQHQGCGIKYACSLGLMKTQKEKGLRNSGKCLIFSSC